jgi:hypothetical protein
MTLTQISNLFNAIVQSYVDMGFYHYGWTSDINVNTQNNFTRGTGRGKLFPALHMDFPSETVQIVQKNVRSTSRIVLIFTETQGYNSDGNSSDPRSVVELHTELKRLAIAVLNEFNRLSRQFTGRDALALTQTPINFTYDANQNNQRLVRLFCEAEIFYLDDCPDFVSDIPSLDPPFNVLPPSNNDYELE